MKTYEQLMTHYWGEIVPMAEAAGIDPWECVKWVKEEFVLIFDDHDAFRFEPEYYTFALKILEGRPVFICDKLWHKENEIWTTILFEHCLKRNIDKYTWTPPTKKRTFITFGLDGNALNDAAWRFIDSYREVMGESESPMLWNNCKQIIAPAIQKYIESIDKD